MPSILNDAWRFGFLARRRLAAGIMFGEAARLFRNVLFTARRPLVGASRRPEQCAAVAEMTRRSGPVEAAEIVPAAPLGGGCDEIVFGSERDNLLWVKFSARDGTTGWIGKFGCGMAAATRVTHAAPPDRFIVVAGGYAYVIDATRRVLLNEYHDPFVCDVAFEPLRNAFVVADYVRVYLIKSGKVRWVSPRIARDGIQNLTVEGQNIRGVAVTGGEAKEEFSIDLESRQLICPAQASKWGKPRSVDVKSSSTAAKRKRWWRFW